MKKGFHWRKTGGPAAQRGAAVVEFAFVFPIFLLILYGIVTFGSVFYEQLAVSRAAEDGARLRLMLQGGDEGVITAQIKSEVIESLRRSLGTVVPAGAITALDEACAGGGDCVAVTITYPYTNPIPAITLPLIGNMGWIPATLTGKATVRLS